MFWVFLSLHVSYCKLRQPVISKIDFIKSVLLDIFYCLFRFATVCKHYFFSEVSDEFEIAW